jgi:hypothetical protein
MLTILMRKRYESDKQASYEALRTNFDGEGVRTPEYRLAEYSFVKAKVHCLLSNFEAASEVF